MKFRFFRISIGVLAQLALLATAGAQSPKARYSVRDLGTLGGSYSFAYAINSSGAVVGGAATENQTDFFSQTAFLSYGGQPINLGTLGGSACPGCSSEGAAASANGTVALLSETAKSDADGEDFCGFGTNRQCLAAVWKNGILSALPTLPGGSNSQAYFVNSQGEIIGFRKMACTTQHVAIPCLFTFTGS